MENQPLIKRFIIFSKFSSLIVITIGLLAIVGWLFNVPALISVILGFQTLKINTAIAFLLAGIALWVANQESLSPRTFRLVQICNSAVFLIGSLTLAEYIFRLDLGIDQLIFRDLLTSQASFPGRMAFATALCFTLVGAASMYIHAESEKVVQAGQYLAGVVLSISFLALVGYAYDVQALYKLDQFSSMALHTAAGLALLALGILSTQADRGWISIISTDTVGGVVLRRLLPFVLGIPIIIGWLIFLEERAGVHETHFGLAMISVLTTGFLVMALWLNSGQLNRIDADRKQAEEQIAYQANLLANVNDAIVASDTQFRLTAWNTAAEVMYGWDADEVLGRTSVEILQTEFQDIDAQEMRQRLTQAGKWRGEATQLRKDGRRVPVELSSITLRNTNGQVTGYLSVNRDITERMRAEEELRALNAELEQRVVERTVSLQSSLNFTRSLYLVAQSVIALESLPDVLQSVVNTVAQTLAADRATVITFDHEAKQSTHLVRAGPGVETVIPTVLYDELMEGLSGWALRELRPAFSPKGQPDPRESPAVQQRRIETNCGCIVVLPLLYLGDTLGTMTVINTPEQPDFTEQEVAWMEAIANQAAIAIGRVQIYDQLKKANLLLEQQSERLQRELIDREHTEAALAAERDLLQALMDNIPDTIYFKDATSRFTRINSAQAKMLGVTTPEAAIGKTDFDFFHTAKLVQSFFEEEQRIIETGEPLINRVEFNPTTDGQPRWLIATKVPIKDSSDRVIGIVGISRDITQRMHVEEALRDAELKYRTLVEHMPVIIYVDLADESRNTVYISPQIQEMLGYSPEDWIAKPDFCNTIIHPEDGERMWRETQEAEVNGRFSCDYRYIAKDGQVVWVHDEAVLLKNDAGEPSVWQGVMLDITAQKQAEEALSQSEERFRLMAWATKDAVWDWNLQTGQIWWGAGLQKIFHYSSETLETDAEWWRDRIHPQDIAKVDRVINQALEGGMEFWSKEYRFQRVDGTYADIMDRAYIIRDKAGKASRMVGAMMDITERKQMELTLLQSNEKLGQSLEELQQHNQETALLNELSHLLQSSQSAKEAYGVMAELSKQLFPHTAGALYMLNEGRTQVNAIASWGELSSASPAFMPNSCRALRRSPTRPLNADQPGMCCLNFADQPGMTYCLPIQVQGEILGIFHLQSTSEENLPENKRQLAYTVVEQSEMALSNLKLRHALLEQSMRDPLTGLYNRRYMEEALKQQLSRVTRQLHPLGLIMIDIDHFKNFNDAYGHTAGDALLRELGRLLQSHIRGGDVACRYGGEEFLLIMPDASLEAAQQRAKQLQLEAKKLRVQDAGQSLNGITLSLGVAIYPEHGRSRDAILRSADAALYRAKQEGRDRVVVAERAY